MTVPLLFLSDYQIGLRCRILRTAKCLRQADVAEMAGVAQAQVSELERGLWVTPTIRDKILTVLQTEDVPQ